MLPSDRLREAGREVSRQIAEQIDASEEVQQVVSRLESRYDEKAEGTVRRSLLADENDELPNADVLGAAVEAYLARENPGRREKLGPMGQGRQKTRGRTVTSPAAVERVSDGSGAGVRA
jgi:hypothetical protein